MEEDDLTSAAKLIVYKRWRKGQSTARKMVNSVLRNRFIDLARHEQLLKHPCKTSPFEPAVFCEYIPALHGTETANETLCARDDLESLINSFGGRSRTVLRRLAAGEEPIAIANDRGVTPSAVSMKKNDFVRKMSDRLSPELV